MTRITPGSTGPAFVIALKKLEDSSSLKVHVPHLEHDSVSGGDFFELTLTGQ